MKKYYIPNEIATYGLELKEGDIIYFEMPPFCSGEYKAEVYRDESGLYIDKENNWFPGCRDLRINQPYWR